MNAIEIRGLVKSFDQFTLGPLDLDVPQGYMVGYIGENGAGKSTTVKLILGLLRPDAEVSKCWRNYPGEPRDKKPYRLCFRRSLYAGNF